METRRPPLRRVGYQLKIVLNSLKGGFAAVIVLLVLIWIGLPLLPKETGLRFGLAFQAFFTFVLFLGVLFFWFLGRERVPVPKGTIGVLTSLAVTFFVTVGILVTAGAIYPQFQRPEPPGAVAQEAADRGKELFWGGTAGCFRCHTIAGKGGTRGPNLTQVASRAGERVQGMSAEQYLSEKIAAGATYQFKVSEYAPMMPPFEQIISREQIGDLVAYLLSLR